VFANKNLKALALAFLQSPEHFGWLLNRQRDQFQKTLIDSQKPHYAEFLGPIIDGNFRKQPSSGPAFAQMTSQLNEEVLRNVGRYPEVEARAGPGADCAEGRRQGRLHHKDAAEAHQSRADAFNESAPAAIDGLSIIFDYDQLRRALAARRKELKLSQLELASESAQRRKPPKFMA
jgi:hypothetical protein